MTAATALATATPVDLRTSRDAFEPATAAEALDLAKTFVRSGLMPRSLGTPEAVFVAIATGRELGLSALQAVRSIHVIEGKPALSSTLIVALCKRSPECRYFRLVESTDDVATYETHRAGEPGPTRLSFTMAQARAAGVAGKDNWRKFPAAMLRARCETALARAVYPDLVMGLYDPEELAPPLREPAPEPVTTTATATVVQPAPAAAPAEPPAVVEATVVEAPAAVPAPVPATPAEPSYRERLLAMIASAKTSADLAAVRAAAKDGKAGGRLVGADYQECLTAYTQASDALRRAGVR